MIKPSSSKSTLAVILSLMLALTASVQAAYSVKSINSKFAVRLVPVTSFAPFYNGNPAGTPDSGVNTAPGRIFCASAFSALMAKEM